VILFNPQNGVLANIGYVKDVRIHPKEENGYYAYVSYEPFNITYRACKDTDWCEVETIYTPSGVRKTYVNPELFELLSYHNEITIRRLGDTEHSRPNTLVLSFQREEKAEYFFLHYRLWTGNFLENELIKGRKVSFSGWILPFDERAGDKRYDVVKVDTLMMLR
jgi:hypothetical protein